MLSEAQSFWSAIAGKVRQLIQGETKNTFRCERYEVTTAPNGSLVGVTLPFGSNEVFLPYSKEIDSATVGDPVLVVWWGSMSNAKVYYFADGYDGAESGSSIVIGEISIPLSWTATTVSGVQCWVATPTITGAVYSNTSVVSLQPEVDVLQSLMDDGVTALYVENDNMALTVYAMGAAPTTALVMQCTLTDAEPSGVGPTPIDPTLDTIYPVGSIYLAATSIDPNVVFGGTWVRIKDTFLLAAGDVYAGGTSGGNAKHSHKYGFQYGEYYEHTVFANDAKAGALNYDQNNNITIQTTANIQDPGTTSSPNYTSTASKNVGHWRAEADASYESSLPPYLAVFVWQRTA